MLHPTITPIDSLRGIFDLLIVWHHLTLTEVSPYHYDFGSTIVLFFFILSGYGISLSWKDKISEKGGGKKFLSPVLVRGICFKVANKMFNEL